MIDKALEIIAPHLCSGCGKTGSLLCSNCKYNIEEEAESRCIACLAPSGVQGVCQGCTVPYTRAWFVGLRKDTLQRLIGLFKFERAVAGHKAITSLINSRLPVLPPNTVVVPIPTVSSHIRERGYDHTHLIAKRLAKIRSLRYERLLERTSTTSQRGASAAERAHHMQHAFRLNGVVDPDTPYLIIDDVVTTGSTIKAAARLLKDAGATEVWVAVAARQSLDD